MSNDSSRRPPPKIRRIDRISRGRAALELLRPRQLQEAAAVSPPVSPRIAVLAGLQTALSLLAAIAVVAVTPWPQTVGYAALGALAALFGRFSPPQRRGRVVGLAALLLTGAVLVTSLGLYAGLSTRLSLLLLALVAGTASLAVVHWRLDGPGVVIIVFAAGGALPPVTSTADLLGRVAATAAGGAVAWLVCKLTDRLRFAEFVRIRPRLPARRPLSHELIAAGRIAAAAAAAAFIALAAGWQHPAWAAIGAVAVLQGRHLHVSMNRAMQRMAGTVIGALLAWAILTQSPEFWTIVALVALLQVLTEAVIGYNYALGQITVTPMALLMTYLVAPASAQAMAMERVLDTLVGAVVGMLFAVLFSTLDDRVYLARRRS